MALTLRRRLTLLVALTIVVPIVAVGVTVVNLIGNVVEQRTYDRLRQAAQVTSATLADDAAEVRRLAEGLARDPRLVDGVGEGGAPLDDALRQALDDLDVDVVVVAAATAPEVVVASARREPVLATGLEAPTDEALLDAAATPAGAAAIGPVAGLAQVPLGTGGTVTVGRWLDATRLAAVVRPKGVELSLVDGRGPVASTDEDVVVPDRADLTGEYEAALGGARRFVVGTRSVPLGVTVLAWSSPPEGGSRSGLILLFVALLVVLTVLIVLVGYVVGGLVTVPVEQLAEAARAVSRGDLSQRVEPAGDRELLSLGRAFNEMTDSLRRYVEELEQSRTEFQAAMARLGDVLVSTHDIAGIIGVVLEACTLTLRAEKALFFERVAMPARIRATAAQGSPVPPIELNGTGLAGAAARELTPLRFPADGDQPVEVELADDEPRVEAAMAVPVVSDGRLFGVIAVYGRSGGGGFRPDDANTLQTLARQTEVAIGNVFLHDETRRQARTDGTTGLWNRREFELRCRESVKEATRFEEPFGIILVDIDDFKRVNDDYDHSTGDAALIWLASRLSEATREIDVVARWGGEEFIVLLPRAGVEETATVAERIRVTVAADPIVDGRKVIPLTVSIGMAVHPADGTNADTLFKAADAALLRAKRMGKNRVERARPDEGAA